MTDAAEQDERLQPESAEVKIVPHSDVSDGTGLVVQIRVVLDGSYRAAQKVFAKSIQEYGEKLASESARQEATGRAPGAQTVEITESAVIRAQEALDQQVAERSRPSNKIEAVSLAGAPIFSGATGVMGSYLTNALNWTVFSLLAMIAASCILYLLKRRLL